MSFVQISKNLRVKELTEQIKENFRKYANLSDPNKLIEYLKPFLKESFDIGTKASQQEYRLWERKTIPIPKDLKWDQKVVLAEFMLKYQEARDIYKIRQKSRKKVQFVNRTKDKAGEIQERNKTEFYSNVMQGIRRLMIEVNNRGFQAMVEHIENG